MTNFASFGSQEVTDWSVEDNKVDLVWHGTVAESNRLLTLIHGLADCAAYGMVDCCESSLYSVNCPAHTLLDSQVTLDLLLACMRGLS